MKYISFLLLVTVCSRTFAQRPAAFIESGVYRSTQSAPLREQSCLYSVNSSEFGLRIIAMNHPNADHCFGGHADFYGDFYPAEDGYLRSKCDGELKQSFVCQALRVGGGVYDIAFIAANGQLELYSSDDTFPPKRTLKLEKDIAYEAPAMRFEAQDVKINSAYPARNSDFEPFKNAWEDAKYDALRKCDFFYYKKCHEVSHTTQPDACKTDMSPQTGVLERHCTVRSVVIGYK